MSPMETSIPLELNNRYIFMFFMCRFNFFFFTMLFIFLRWVKWVFDEWNEYLVYEMAGDIDKWAVPRAIDRICDQW